MTIAVDMGRKATKTKKKQRWENCKENNECLTIHQGVRTNKTVKILDMSLRLKKVQFIRPISQVNNLTSVMNS